LRHLIISVVNENNAEQADELATGNWQLEKLLYGMVLNSFHAV
jgi:hypothetical protein